MDYYQQFIAKSRYSRFLPELNRREHWHESVNRYMVFMYKHLQDKHNYKMPDDLYKEIKDAIINLEVMPSMRAIMTAGKALERDNTAGYTSSATVPASLRQAMLLKIGYLFENRDQITSQGMMSEEAYERIMRRWMRPSYP